jgi:hypothetical protein
MHFDFLYKFLWNISFSEKNSARYDQKIISSLHLKYLLFLSDFSETWIFETDFRKVVMKILPVRAEFFHAVRRTDRHDEANSRFSEFCE